MKTRILVFMLLLASMAFGQIKVTENKYDLIGEYKLLGTSYARLMKQDSICVLVYRDEQYTRFDDYKHFVFGQKDLDSIYALFTDFNSVGSKTVELENGDQLIFEYKKMLSRLYAEVTHIAKSGIVGKLRYLTISQTKKLFGK